MFLKKIAFSKNKRNWNLTSSSYQISKLKKWSSIYSITDLFIMSQYIIGD